MHSPTLSIYYIISVKVSTLPKEKIWTTCSWNVTISMRWPMTSSQWVTAFKGFNKKLKVILFSAKSGGYVSHSDGYLQGTFQYQTNYEWRRWGDGWSIVLATKLYLFLFCNLLITNHIANQKIAQNENPQQKKKIRKSK